MNNKPQRICPITNKLLPADAHGNRKYLDEPAVEKIVKGAHNGNRYDRIRQLDNQALRLDGILAKHYHHSEGWHAVNKSILDQDGFRWDFNSAMSKVNGSVVYWILDYGYSIKNKEIIIYYGNNPLRQL